MPTMAWTAGVPEIVGACGEPTLTPDEPTPGPCELRVCPPLTPTWPQPVRIAAESAQTSRYTAHLQRGLATLIDTPCFNRPPFAATRNLETGDGRRERGRRRACLRQGSCRQPRYLSSSHETGGFASPPHGGFAPSTTNQTNTSTETNTIHTELANNRQPVALRRRLSVATVNLAMQHRLGHHGW